MSRKQQAVLLSAVVLIGIAGLFPPWKLIIRQDGTHTELFIGFRFLLTPPYHKAALARLFPKPKKPSEKEAKPSSEPAPTSPPTQVSPNKEDRPRTEAKHMTATERLDALLGIEPGASRTKPSPEEEYEARLSEWRNELEKLSWYSFVRLDWTHLAIEWLLIILVTCGLLLFFRDWRSAKPKHQANL